VGAGPLQARVGGAHLSRLTCALGPDAAGTMVARLVRGSRRSIDAAVYEVGPSYRWELVRAARRGVRVRLVLDAHLSDGNAATARELIAAGGACRVAGVGRDRAHGKLLVSDARCVALGSGNLIWRDAPRDRSLRFPPDAPPLAGTREWWVMVSRSIGVRRAARSAFEAHWSTAIAPPEGWSGSPAIPAPVVGTPLPQVAPSARCVAGHRLHLVIGGSAVWSALRRLITTSRRRVLVTVPYVHAKAAPVADLIEVMVGATTRGVACALLLGDAPLQADAVHLEALPFPVRRMDPARSTSGHAKGAIADGAVLVSSANWSSSGLGGNWEAALHIDEPAAAAYYAAAWRRDWDSGLGLDV
jgi:phosphatidylserine/phosphatidylglycerophosphate/cardiolipin synthase-like enzyme